MKHNKSCARETKVRQKQKSEAMFGDGATPGDSEDSEKEIHYSYNEVEYVQEVMDYIDNTYVGHYAGKVQALDNIYDAGHGTGFNVGSILKYAKRYGKKKGYNRDDIMKIIHYGILQLHIHDSENLGYGDETDEYFDSEGCV